MMLNISETTAPSAASALKARLSAKKPKQPYPPSFSAPYPVHLFHPASVDAISSPLKTRDVNITTTAASPSPCVRQLIHVVAPPALPEQQQQQEPEDEHQFAKASYKLASSLIKTDKPQARRVLNALAVQREQVITTAAFWEACLAVERGDDKRTAACFLLALENCTLPQERRVLVDSLVVEHFKRTANGPTKQTELLPPPPPQREDVKSIGSILEKMSLLDSAKKATEVVATDSPHRHPSPLTHGRFCSPEPVFECNLEWWQQQPCGEEDEDELLDDENRTPEKQLHFAVAVVVPASVALFASPKAAAPTTPQYKSRLASPAVRVTSSSTADKRKAPSSATKQQPATPLAAGGLVVVLSPMRESRRSETKVATPVRRSTRINHIPSVECKNRSALEECGFSYAPNAALQSAVPVVIEEVEHEQHTPRRSVRATKPIVRFAAGH